MRWIESYIEYPSLRKPAVYVVIHENEDRYEYKSAKAANEDFPEAFDLEEDEY